MFQVWYNMCGEYAEEIFDSIDDAFKAFDEAINASHHAGDYIELKDLKTGKIIEWFENGEADYNDDVDESNYDPYLGQDVFEGGDEIW